MCYYCHISNFLVMTRFFLPSDELFLCNSEPYFIGCLYCFLSHGYRGFLWTFSPPTPRPLPPPTSSSPALYSKHDQKARRKSSVVTAEPSLKDLYNVYMKSKWVAVRLRFSHPTTSLSFPCFPES